MENTKDQIPYGEGTPVAETDLDVPSLPNDWEWLSVNRTSNGKVNVLFGKSQNEVGGWLGEIDNYIDTEDGEKVESWDIHIREIVEVEHRGEEGEPASEPATVEKCASLSEAISKVSHQINTFYV